MTELYIRGESVVLPKDLQFKLTEDNPELTSNGEYTWDLSASLMNATNARIFRNIFRKDISTAQSSDDAVLVIDNRVRFGTVVYLRNANNAIEFQFIAGNSQLNYIAKSDKKIWLYDFGEENQLTLQDAIFSITHKGYGAVVQDGVQVGFNNYVCAPVKIDDKIANDYKLDTQANDFAIISEYYNISEIVPLGTASYYTLDTAVKAVPEASRKGNFVLLFNSDADTQVAYQYKLYATDSTNWESAGNWSEFYPKFIIQPYLLYYINRLPELIGFELTDNVLNDDARAKVMYMTNSILSLRYSDFLPDISVTEFIQFVEEFFNVRFLANSKNKTMSIVSVKSGMAAKHRVKLNVVDDYERDIDTDSSANIIDFTKVEYNLGDNTWFNFQRLSEENLKFIDYVDFATMAAFKTYLKATSGLGNKMKVYRIADNGNHYFVADYREWNVDGHVSLYSENVTWSTGNGRTGGYTIFLINKFRPFGESDDKTLQLNICPAEISTRGVPYIYVSGRGSTYASSYMTQLPVCSNKLYDPEAIGFVELVEQSQAQTPRSSFIEVSLYTGLIAPYIDEPAEWENLARYPYSNVDKWPEFPAPEHNWISGVFQAALPKTMKTVDVAADYLMSSFIKTSSLYVFTFSTDNKFNSSCVANINGKEYIPAAIEYDISQEGVGKECTGYFYELII